MPNKKISELSATNIINNIDDFVINQSGITKRVSFSDLSTKIKSEVIVDINNAVIMPVGVIMMFPSLTIPTGWLECNGQTLSILAIDSPYKNLFNVIRYTYGGSGNSFNLPDLRGVFIRGLDNGRGLDSGRTLSAFQEDDFESHTHKYGNTHSTLYGMDALPYAGVNPSASINYNTGATGGSETRPKNMALVYCIKY